MNKNTLTFERKLYVAPACKTHVLQVEENIMSEYGTADYGFDPNNNLGGLGEEDGD